MTATAPAPVVTLSDVSLRYGKTRALEIGRASCRERVL